MLWAHTTLLPDIDGVGNGFIVIELYTVVLHPVAFIVCSNDTVPDEPLPQVTFTVVPVGEPFITPPVTVHEFDVPATTPVE